MQTTQQHTIFFFFYRAGASTHSLRPSLSCTFLQTIIIFVLGLIGLAIQLRDKVIVFWLQSAGKRVKTAFSRPTRPRLRERTRPTQPRLSIIGCSSGFSDDPGSTSGRKLAPTPRPGQAPHHWVLRQLSRHRRASVLPTPRPRFIFARLRQQMWSEISCRPLYGHLGGCAQELCWLSGGSSLRVVQ